MSYTLSFGFIATVKLQQREFPSYVTNLYYVSKLKYFTVDSWHHWISWMRVWGLFVPTVDPDLLPMTVPLFVSLRRLPHKTYGRFSDGDGVTWTEYIALLLVYV